MERAAEPLIVDATGHRCPIPSLRLRRAIERTGGDRPIVLWADDPMARIDVPHLLNEMGWALVEVTEDGGRLSFRAEPRQPGSVTA
ncbi:sulfurtransferase TusA family protein [Brevundimonas sp. 2R-24]|uniref:Sulfurtransferase TusA family protein n=1 Tax=Peiella sedimenti TaxID=3061083 RepID=A0ABT8SKN0_9CAUL|nr:sulfurtransferase TusA family protein [Caulobacteraceae bacterium XZ-24]